jgi:hypothetical protein
MCWLWKPRCEGEGCAAGRDEGSFSFEISHIRQQLQFYLSVFRALAAAGAPFTRSRVAITELAAGPSAGEIKNQILAPLSHEFPEVSCHLDPERMTGRGYYQSLCFKVFTVDRDGKEMEIGDGGMTDWTQKLIADRKERLLISGIGVDRLLLVDRA